MSSRPWFLAFIGALLITAALAWAGAGWLALAWAGVVVALTGAIAISGMCAGDRLPPTDPGTTKYPGGLIP